MYANAMGHPVRVVAFPGTYVGDACLLCVWRSTVPDRIQAALPPSEGYISTGRIGRILFPSGFFGAAALDAASCC
jgi:hypothetical protein